jgi:hypothetical protein
LAWRGDASGQPEKYAIMAGEIFFRPIPDAAYTVTINYQKRYSPFSSDADTNYLLTSGSNVLLYAALLEAEAYLGAFDIAAGRDAFIAFDHKFFDRWLFCRIGFDNNYFTQAFATSRFSFFYDFLFRSIQHQ